jgi:hypothetical protein
MRGVSAGCVAIVGDEDDDGAPPPYVERGGQPAPQHPAIAVASEHVTTAVTNKARKQRMT